MINANIANNTLTHVFIEEEQSDLVTNDMLNLLQYDFQIIINLMTH